MSSMSALVHTSHFIILSANISVLSKNTGKFCKFLLQPQESVIYFHNQTDEEW